MKKKSDPRHKKRTRLMQELFSWQFGAKRKPSKNLSTLIPNISIIDQLIAKSAPDRPISEINKIDLAILRLAVFELIIEKGAPPKVIIDEAVELGKEYGSDSSSSFINGALGKLIKVKEIVI